MAWALRKIEKEKPAAGKTDYWRGFWRSGWDSNPRNLAVQLISSQSRYDHFDTAPYLSQHQHLGKRGELMGRTKKNIQLKTPEKPRKIKGFRSGSCRIATTISSQPRYDHFDTSACMFCAASRFQRKNLWATLWATQPQYSIFEPSENPEITGFPMA